MIKTSTKYFCDTIATSIARYEKYRCWASKVHRSSGKKKEPKPKLFGPDIFGWGGGLPREGVGAKKFGMSFETQGNQTFCRDIPGFCRHIPEVPDNQGKTKGQQLKGKIVSEFFTPFHTFPSGPSPSKQRALAR